MVAMAAPIPANLRIDSSEIVLYPTAVIPTVPDLQPEPMLLPTLNENLTWVSTELHWEQALIFPGADLGELPEQNSVAGAPIPRTDPPLAIAINEPPAVVMSGTGFGMGAVMLWRRRERTRVRRRRRLIFRQRAMSPVG